ncbi:NMT1-like family protein [Acidovorax sp. 56]|nr:NMT1-like family protein [Acidovorax sp. 56]
MQSPKRLGTGSTGKTVIVSSARGSISQYQLYGALEEAGVKREEVTVKFVLPTDAAAAFASRQIDAWAIFDPYYTIALQQGGRILRDGRGINTALGFITATDTALADPAKRAAIVQYLDRLARAGEWALANREAQNLFKVFLEIALECNRDEWMLRVRRMGSCPCKQPGRPIARFHSNPSGKCLAGRSAALHRLPIARAIGRALRLASHPGQTLVQLQKDFEQVLPQVYTQLTRLPIEAARTITGRAAIAARPVTQADVTALQTVADRSARDGILPVRVDVAAITDAQVWRGAA